MLAMLRVSSKLEKMDGDAFAAKITALDDGQPVFDQASLNAAAAKFHGISVDALVSSASYEALLGIYQKSNAKKLLDLCRAEGFDDKEAWAFVVYAIQEGEL